MMFKMAVEDDGWGEKSPYDFGWDWGWVALDVNGWRWQLLGGKR